MTPDAAGAGGDSRARDGRGDAAPAPSAAAPGPGERWTPLRLVLWSARYLEERGIEQARLEAEHLLAHALGTGRLQIYLQHERPLTPEELAAFKPLLLRRAAREPLQYVVGRTSFRELELGTDPRALIPRPETEVLVEVVLEWARQRAARAGEETAGRPDVSRADGMPGGEKVSGPERTLSGADVGTGTGCIALSLALEGPFRRVVATDASPAALELAAENARRVGEDVAARVELRQGDLLAPLAGERFDALVSNPPYVAESDREGLEPEVRDFEPRGALFAGRDGLDVIRPLVAGAARHLLPGGLLALEVGPGQARHVAELIGRTEAFQPARVRRDLAGRPRVVSATLRSRAPTSD